METRIKHCQALLEERFHHKRGHPERSFLKISDLNQNEFRQVIDGGLEFKAKPDKARSLLSGVSAGLLFQKTSTRTRCSFEIGISEMDGIPMYIDWNTSNFVLADLQDEVRVLSRYVDLIVARMNRHEDLVLMKNFSEVPVINGMSDLYHPCQGLADFMTMKEYFGELKDLTVCYIGDGNNVCHSLIDGAPLGDVNLIVVTPPAYKPNASLMSEAKSSKRIFFVDSIIDAVKQADVVYTDTWVSIGYEKEKEKRLATFKPYQVNEELLNQAPKHAIVMHCLPAHRGLEITASVMDSKNCVVFEQAENRKHVQKYLTALILEKEKIR